jgi:FixJ family two-component response regulator
MDQASAFLFSEAASGEGGLRLASALEPVCNLLDYQLPDVTGLEFLDRLRSRGDGAVRSAVVMLTGNGNEAVAVEAMKKGTEDYLVKASDGDRLRQAVRSAIEKRSMRQEIEIQRLELLRLGDERERLIAQLNPSYSPARFSEHKAIA